MKSIFSVIISIPLFLGLCLAGDEKEPLSKRDYYNQVIAPEKGRQPLQMGKVLGFEDRKRSVMDRGNMVLRLSNAAIYGYDRWGLNHEFPNGSMLKEGCCTYYWTQSPIVGALIDGQPSVAVGVRGSVRDSEEEYEPLPGYDAGYTDTKANIGIAFSDIPESWPDQWPIEKDPTGTYTDPQTGETFSGIEAPLHANLRFPVPPFMKESFPVDDPDKRIAYFVVTDNDPQEGNTLASNGVGPLNVRFDVWTVNDASVFANDGLIFIQLMTNVGSDTLKELYMGIAGDPDTPEQGGAEWTDDLAMFITSDDPHIAEKLSDTSDAHLLENFALVWDSDDKAEGFKGSDIGWIGLKFLEATKLNSDGTQTSYDASTVYSYEYSQDAQSDAQAYNEQLKGGIQTPHNITPHPDDIFEKPYSYGPDITWVIAAGPMEIAPGEQVIFTFADFMGVNEKDLIGNAKLFQSYYDNRFRTPKPPPAPAVQAIAGDGQVALFWDTGETETAVDPVTGNSAFEGYRVYRSLDRGKTWGKVITDVNGSPSGQYLPLAIFDLSNGVTGSYSMGNYAFDLGNDGGLQYSFVDKSAINGYEYWYSVTAFDGPDDWAGTPVQPLENSKASNAFIDGDNTVSVVPQTSPAGYDVGAVTSVTHSGLSDATLQTFAANAFTYEFLGDKVVQEEDFISKGHDYEITLSVENDTVYYWSMVDLSSGDSVITRETDVSSGKMKHVIDGFVPIFENGSWAVSGYDSIRTLADSDTSTRIAFAGLGGGGDEDTWYGFMKFLSDAFPQIPPPAARPDQLDLQQDLEIRFSPSGSIATYYKPQTILGQVDVDTILVPFELWSLESDSRINVAVYQVAGAKPSKAWEAASDTNNAFKFTANLQFIPVYSPYDGSTVHFSDDAAQMGWVIKFLKDQTLFEFGNVFQIFFKNPLIPGGDVFRISTSSPDYTVEDDSDLDDILVVPNPYVAFSQYEFNIEVKEIQFTHLPDECVIRIYNLSGDLVRLLKHEPGSEGYRGPSIEAWNLRTYNDQEVAFGVYVYYVIADNKEKIGKFAVIK